MQNSVNHNKILAFLIALIPLAKPYLIFGINADFLLIGITCVLFYVHALCNGGLGLYKPLSLFLLFTIYSITIPPLCSTFFYGNQFSFTYVPLVLFLIINISYRYVDINDLFKAYTIFVYLSCFFFFLQEISYHVLGARISGLLPFFENVYSRSLHVNSSDFIANQLESDRSSSIFLEPAHFVQYIAPCLMIMLFKKEHYSIFGIVLITAAMLLSFSGNGMLLLGITYFLFIIKSNLKKSTKFILFGLMLAASVVFLNTDEGEKLMNRKSELSITDMERHSGFIRVYRGYFLWNELDPLAKIVGIGGNNDFLFNNNQYSWMMVSDEDRFLNGAQQVLIADGVIGLLLFLLFIRKLFKEEKAAYCSKAIIISFCGLMLIESIFNTSFMALYFVLIVCLNKQSSSTRSLSY